MTSAQCFKIPDEEKEIKCSVSRVPWPPILGITVQKVERPCPRFCGSDLCNLDLIAHIHDILIRMILILI